MKSKYLPGITRDSWAYQGSRQSSLIFFKTSSLISSASGALARKSLSSRFSRSVPRFWTSSSAWPQERQGARTSAATWGNHTHTHTHNTHIDTHSIHCSAIYDMMVFTQNIPKPCQCITVSFWTRQMHSEHHFSPQHLMDIDTGITGNAC